MWLVLAFVSATFLGFYDTSKKASLKGNAVLPVLFLNTVFSTLIFSPFLLDYLGGFGWFTGTFLDTVPFSGTDGSMLKAHLLVVLKAFIVLSSWICGYFGLKHLPLTIVGPINATRPVLVLIGAMLIFGERLNTCQWIGVILAICSVFLMSRASKKENIDFKHNKWIWCVGLATIIGVISGLYDKFIMKSLNPMFVQSWFNFYQLVIMAVICGLIWYPKRHETTPFQWRWSILLISLFICIADFAYYTSLNDPDSMISVVSLVRRGSVVISFACAVIFFKERNLKAKILDLALLLIGMAFIWIGTNQ
ncbi:MAG: EamA family transporter [Bacteroidales bacterium]|nr:EamA family transporter [Bacteroidales bacterium]